MPKSPSTKSFPRTSPAVSALESHLGFWLRFVSNHVSGAFQRLMEENGVSVTEWVALRQVFQTGLATPAELVDATGMTKGAVSKVIDRLESKGLLARQVVQEDARAQKVGLTRSGRALVPRLAALADQNDEAFFGHLSGDTRRELLSVLQDLVKRHGLQQMPLQ